MKNKEKYAKEIVESALSGELLTVNNEGLPCRCCDIICADCLFYSLRCDRNKKIKQWAEKEYHEPILDEVEKQYLSAVIKPFRDLVISICKKSIQHSNLEYIWIDFKDGIIDFPPFEKNTMYKGMETDKKYTLEELGL